MSVDLARTCVEDFRKYSDTVTTAAAIYHLFASNPSIGHFIGIEHKLVTSNPDEILTPDITAVYNSDSKGLLFELKYSLPTEVGSVKDELLKLEKYSRVQGGWRVKGPVQSVDFILICHIDDVSRAVEGAQQVFAETGKPFYNPTSFSIWYWTIPSARGDERREEMRLLHAYGATRNDLLQQMIKMPGGILAAEEVLTTLRFTYPFIRQKPPVQYIIVFLMQNVFSALPPPSRAGRRFYNVDLDHIYQKTNALFPPWWERDVQTVQVRRGWVKEALDTLVKLRLIMEISDKPDWYSIPIPTLVTRKPLHEVICRKLGRIRRLGRPTAPKPVPKRRPAGVRPLTEFLQE